MKKYSKTCNPKIFRGGARAPQKNTTATVAGGFVAAGSLNTPHTITTTEETHHSPGGGSSNRIIYDDRCCSLGL